MFPARAAGNPERKTEMATINAAFYLITGALEADQSALDVVANNVANSNTPGYTREIANWRENAPVQINGVSYGAGVSQTGPSSVRDRVLEQRLAQQQQAASQQNQAGLNEYQKARAACLEGRGYTVK